MIATTPFDARQLERYSRQIMLKGFGGRGQRRLREATIALRCRAPHGDAPGRLRGEAICDWVVAYLVAAGVGRLSIEREPRYPLGGRDDARALNDDCTIELVPSAGTGRPNLLIDCLAAPLTPSLDASNRILIGHTSCGGALLWLEGAQAFDEHDLWPRVVDNDRRSPISLALVLGARAAFEAIEHLSGQLLRARTTLYDGSNNQIVTLV
ncbi:MAG: hypothetical protein KC609_26425 [Myxococcales bacterium]|nr:hypothetical protein [Myxococcales bacterium]